MNHLDELLHGLDKKRNKQCFEAIEYMGPALLGSFGLDFDQLNVAPNLEKGYNRAKPFLDQVCALFDDPKHIIRVAPFAQAYLGPETFTNVLEVVLQRAKEHPQEQPFLDEVFTGISLLRPELRSAFLDEIRSAPIIDKELFSLDYTIAKIDPKLSFSSAAEFPKEFNTSDVNKAALLLSYFLESGFYHPISGFTDEYKQLNQSLRGFEFLLNPADDKTTLFITQMQRQDFFQGLVKTGKSQFTKAFDTREQAYTENPAVVVVNEPVHIQEVRRIYRNSTIVYAATDKRELEHLAPQLDNPVESVVLIQNPSDKILSTYLSFIKRARGEYGQLDLGSLIDRELSKAEHLLEEGNEFFYDVRDQFESLGRRELVDALVARKNLELPLRTDNSLVMLLSDKNKISDYFGEHTRMYGRKKLKLFHSLPDIRETGMPFVVITDKVIPASELTQKYKALTLIYLAHSQADENAIRQINGETPVFVLNAEQVAKTIGRYPSEIGSIFMKAFFEDIGKYRGKGITAMSEITSQIAKAVQEKRDAILFSPSANDFHRMAMDLYQLQEKYRVFPQVQHIDKTTTPTKGKPGFIEIAYPETGGCCGGGNLPDILIRFAIEYRKNVGDAAFLDEWKLHQGAKPQQPWYAQRREYTRVFPNFDATQKTKQDKLRF